MRSLCKKSASPCKSLCKTFSHELELVGTVLDGLSRSDAVWTADIVWDRHRPSDAGSEQVRLVLKPKSVHFFDMNPQQAQELGGFLLRLGEAPQLGFGLVPPGPALIMG